jgi:superfamily II DNA/RNA helicase
MRLLKIHCIVATDLIARGVDLPDVQLVINFDVPPLEQELIHRIGRAGRFGASGLALNFVSPDDKKSKTLASF